MQSWNHILKNQSMKFIFINKVKKKIYIIISIDLEKKQQQTDKIQHEQTRGELSAVKKPTA